MTNVADFFEAAKQAFADHPKFQYGKTLHEKVMEELGYIKWRTHAGRSA